MCLVQDVELQVQLIFSHVYTPQPFNQRNFFLVLLTLHWELESWVVPPDTCFLGLLLAELELQLPALVTLVPQVLAVLAQDGQVSGHGGRHGIQVLVAP